MGKDDDSLDRFAGLRRRAIARMPRRFEDVNDISNLSVEDVQSLVHDLHVHRMELELQNEELLVAQQAAEEALDKYSDLYDFAPVGYFTIDSRGVINESNLTCASVLDVRREELIGHNFRDFVAAASQDDWFKFTRRVFRSTSRETCEVTVRIRSGGTFHARLEGLLIKGRKGQRHVCRTVMTDVTDLKEAHQRLATALEEKQAMVREVHHRVKNNLSVIHSLLTLHSQLAMDEASRQAFLEAQVRIRSMVVAHEILYRSESLASLQVAEYMENLANHILRSHSLPGREISVIKQIENVSCSIDTAIPVGFILTELITNCLKHAFTGRTKGEIRVVLQMVDPGEYMLVVADNGVGAPADMDPENGASVGMELITSFVERLRGVMEIRREHGTEVRIRFREIGGHPKVENGSLQRTDS